jgi:hypothetical protein
VLERLDQLVDEIGSLNRKLILLIGPPRSGKTRLLNDLAKRRQIAVLNVGSALGRELLAVSSARRHLKTAALLKDLADGHAAVGLVLLDNIELLFDRTLQLNPLDLLKRHAHAHRVVAAWPGELNQDRLSYATMGHPERQDYAVDGLVPFEIN